MAAPPPQEALNPAGPEAFIGGAAAAAVPRRPGPVPERTSVDEYLSLLAAQQAECVALTEDIKRVVDANAAVAVGVDSVIYMYQRAANGTLMRAPASAVFTSRVYAAEVAPADVVLPVAPTDTIPVFSLVHTPVTRRAADMLAEWTAPADCIVTAIEDPWGKPCDYTFKSFGDAMRLIPIMLSYAKHYKKHGDNIGNREEVHVFWTNYDSIHRALAGLHTLLSGVGPSLDLDAAGRQVDTLNSAVAALGRAGVRTTPRAPPFDPKLKSLIDGGAPVDIATSAASLLSAHLTSRGLAASIEMKLLYSGTRDGMTSTAYHSRVDGQRRLLTLICGDGHWCGAYTNAAPTSTNGSYTSDSNACLMTISNPHGIAPTTYPIQEEQAKYAMLTSTSYGPVFGGGADLFVRGPAFESDTYCGFPSSFVDSTGKGNVTFTGKQSGWRVTAIIVVQV